MIRSTLMLIYIIVTGCGQLAGQNSCACTGSVPPYAAGTEPACDAARRGTVIMSLGETGQPDLLKACVRDGAGRYAWLATGQQNTNTFVNSRKIQGCPVFPDNNVWNSRVDKLPVDAASAAIIETYANARLGTVPDFVLNFADAATPAAPVTFDSSESDGGLYPIRGDMNVEGYAFGTSFPLSAGPYSGDAHLVVLRTDECKLYEIYNFRSSTPPYMAGAGATFDLTSNNLRTDGWTSADAAGLPIWPGVLTYDELNSDAEIQHMLRFTVNRTRDTYIWPARHYASRSDDPALPPMGSRWRLKASFDETTCRENERSSEAFPGEVTRLIRALKRYGMILADNGLAIKLTTDADPRWGDPDSESSPNWRLNGWAHCITGQDFEVVNTAVLMADPNSAAAAK